MPFMCRDMSHTPAKQIVAMQPSMMKEMLLQYKSAGI